jgi:hypothetical protein
MPEAPARIRPVLLTILGRTRPVNIELAAIPHRPGRVRLEVMDRVGGQAHAGGSAVGDPSGVAAVYCGQAGERKCSLLESPWILAAKRC